MLVASRKYHKRGQKWFRSVAGFRGLLQLVQQGVSSSRRPSIRCGAPADSAHQCHVIGCDIIYRNKGGPMSICTRFGWAGNMIHKLGTARHARQPNKLAIPTSHSSERIDSCAFSPYRRVVSPPLPSCVEAPLIAPTPRLSLRTKSRVHT